MLSRWDLSFRDISLANVKGRWNGMYVLNVSHPVATLARSWRKRTRALRGKTSPHEQRTRLPQVEWRDVFEKRKIFLTETAKRDGNVSLGELGILAEAAAATPSGREIIEIGTFDGRTTINLAINAPAGSSIMTLDLPPHQATHFPLVPGERLYVEKPVAGERYRQCGEPWSSAAQRITQLLGDSATFDWSSHYGKAGLVFVDGSHSYEYVRLDSATAMRLVADDGVVLWHDYGVWEGVTRALDDLERTTRLGLRHIRATSLVLWCAPGR